MIVSHWIQPFRRQGVIIDECLWVKGKPYFSQTAIGKWLGYQSPLSAVTRIVKRNSFILNYSKKINTISQEKYELEGDRVTNLATVSTRKRVREIQFFDLEGLLLIAMKATTKKAIEYQIAAARVLKAFLEGKLVERKPDQAEAEQILIESLDADYGDKGWAIEEYMEKMGVTMATAYRHKAKLAKGESPFDKKYGNFKKPIISGKLELEIRDIFYQDPNTPPIVIWRAIGAPKHPAYNTIKRFVKRLKEERAGDPQAGQEEVKQ